MSIHSARQLLDAAQNSGLLTVAEAHGIGEAFDTQKIVTAPDAAVELVRNQTLTQFQIDELFAGRGEECIIAGRYRIAQKLGEGAMGAVYSAYDLRLERTVAVKMLPPGSLANADAVARFHREAKALAKLSHPHIVQAYDVGEDRGRHFVVMEHIEGQNLQRVLAERGPLPPPRAADYICQAALGLQHAHEKGLVHRDLKPSNLLVTSDRQVKIVDLGLARFFQDQLHSPDLTREGTGMGTPDYMPPEQFRDAHSADPRADIYSLGCTFYHLLTGEVPFPGSSISEKCRAHEETLPPLEAKCPDLPGGLVEIVLRMMAKNPEARFATALEAAQALVPYAASGSASSAALRGSWQGRLAPAAKRKPAPSKRRWAIGATAAVALVALLSWIVPQWVNGPTKGQGQPGQNPPPDPNVLTISKEAKDGGQFRTLNAALEQAKPGMRIVVLDDAVYPETFNLSGRGFEGVTLESPKRATITSAQKTPFRIVNVPRLTLRGFRLRAEGSNQSVAIMQGHCPGALLDDLEFDLGGASQPDGLTLFELGLKEEDLPLVVQNCHFRGASTGLIVAGAHPTTKAPLCCSRIVVRNNRFSKAAGACVALFGCVQQVHIVGNRLEVGGASGAGLVFQDLQEAEDVLVANNTIYEPGAEAFRLADADVHGERIELRNNLILAPLSADMAFVRSGAEFGNILRLPTETEKLLELWQFSHNWRETVPPQANTPEALGWIPRAQRDVLQESIEVLSREPAHPDFLRPPGGSKLATEGAGNEIEELPPYVGAIPPPEVPPWNWQRTWDARHKYLFTVSQQEAVGGEFRSLNAALARARPNSTIRVLDDAVYHETLAINSPTRHAGVTLETANGATVQAELQNANLVQVAAVPNVTLRGFKLRAPGGLACIVTKNNCPGLTLERLHCGGSQIGIEVIHNSPGRDGLPIVIKNCEFEQMAGGVRLIGAEPYSVPIVNSRIVVCDNTFRACHFAITIMGDSRDILVAGNRVLQAAGYGIQLENLVGEPERILIANNTLFECGCSVRLWDNVARGKQIELRNNLSLAPLVVDMAWSDNGGTRDTTAGPGEGAALSWQMDCNWREGKQPADPMLSKAWIPPAPNDELHDAIPGLSRDASSPDFLRPRVNSPLATKGAGRIDKSLPEYVGAVPPDGKPWNWDVTWQERSGTHAKRSPP